MDLNTATKIIRTLAAALGLDPAGVTVTVSPYKGDGSRSHFKGYVIASAGGVFWKTWQGGKREFGTREHRNTDLALESLVDAVRKEVESQASEAEKTAATARNEAQVALSRAEESEAKASAMRAALAAI
jgi:hypothetical protein